MTEKDKAIMDIFKTAKDRYSENLLYALPDNLAKKLKSFMLIREDLSFVCKIVEQLIALKSSSDFDNTSELALWQSIIITYGKCFTENRSGMSKLERSILEKHHETYQVIHDHLMDLRHSYVAHRDDTVHEQARVFVKVSKTGYIMHHDTEHIIIARKLASPRVSDLEALLKLLSLLIEEVSAKIQKHGDKAHKTFLEKFSPQQAKSLLINNMKFD